MYVRATSSRLSRGRFTPAIRAISDHLPSSLWAPVATSAPGQAAGRVRSRRLRARRRTPPGAALQRPGESEMRGRGSPLDAAPLSRSDAVVRLRRHVLDAQDLEARGLERADG